MGGPTLQLDTNQYNSATNEPTSDGSLEVHEVEEFVVHGTRMDRLSNVIEEHFENGRAEVAKKFLKELMAQRPTIGLNFACYYLAIYGEKNEDVVKVLTRHLRRQDKKDDVPDVTPIYDRYNDAYRLGIMIPHEHAIIIASHVNAILDSEVPYARELSWDDFQHGHLLFDQIHLETPSFDDYLSGATAHLYHTREHIDDRQTDSTPRSLLGLEDGQVVPVTGTHKNYHEHGTVYAEDIHIDGAKREYRRSATYIKTEAGELRAHNGQFLIVPTPKGRFKTNSGMKFDIYLEVTTMR